MKYAILIYDDPNDLQRMAAEGMYEEYEKFANGLVERGQMRGGEQLAAQSVTTLRSENGKTIVTDGPFAETKEQLAGFYLIEARDLNDAIHVAAKIPPAREGSVEVRPVRELVV